MGYWEEVRKRLNKTANFDAHDTALKANGGMGSQILVPTHMNDKTPVDPSHHKFIADSIKNAGLKHEQHQATGGWMSDDHGLMTEGITVHRGYGANGPGHTNVRENALPYINKNLKQEASLGTFDGNYNGPEKQKPFSFTSLRARLPVSLDVNDPQNKEYRNMMANLATRHAGFTHYQLPGQSQIELHSADPEELKASQQDIENFLQKHHGATGKYDYPTTKAYLQFAPPKNIEHTSSLNYDKHLMAPIRNMIFELFKAAKKGDSNAQNYLEYLGIDK
jgi:hypothetical protein